MALPKYISRQSKDALADLVRAQIAKQPVERGGAVWAAFRQEVLAKTFDVTPKTIRDWISQPPFQYEVVKVGGEKRTLLRLLADGEEPRLSPERLANIMRKVWAEKVGTKLNGKQHGCLIGLAREWPEGQQVAIFKYVLANWPEFMDRVKAELYALAGQHGVKIKNAPTLEPSFAAKLGLTPATGPLPEIEGLEFRYLRFPSITYLRPFHAVGRRLYLEHLHEKDVGKGSANG